MRFLYLLRLRIPRIRRFSLRTMFVVMTITSISLGWHVERVRQRRTTLEWIHHNGGAWDSPIRYLVCWPNRTPLEAAAFRIKYAWNQVSEFVRRSSGDRAISSITLPDNLPLTDVELDRIKSLFPEAIVERSWESVARFEARRFPWLRAPAVSRDRDEK